MAWLVADLPDQSQGQCQSPELPCTIREERTRCHQSRHPEYKGSLWVYRGMGGGHAMRPIPRQTRSDPPPRPSDRPVTWTGKIAWRCARPRARSPQGDGALCLRQLSANACPRCGRDARAPRGRTDLQDRVEMRPASGAEPAGRRGALPTPAVGQRVPPMRARRPRSQGKIGGGPPRLQALGSSSINTLYVSSIRHERGHGTGRATHPGPARRRDGRHARNAKRPQEGNPAGVL
jgi:hypothetical protein